MKIIGFSYPLWRCKCSMQPSLTFLHLDINLQTILTGNKRNNLVSKRNKIELIDFRTFYFAKRFILYGFTSMKDDIKFFRNIFRLSCVGYSFIEAALISKFFKKKKHVIQYLRIKIDQRPIDSYFQQRFTCRWLDSIPYHARLWIKRKYSSLLLAHCTDESELNYQPVSMLELTRITGPGTRFRVTRSICTLL